MGYGAHDERAKGLDLKWVIGPAGGWRNCRWLERWLGGNGAPAGLVRTIGNVPDPALIHRVREKLGKKSVAR